MSDYSLAVTVYAYPDGSFEGTAMFRPAGWRPGDDCGGNPKGGGASGLGRDEQPEQWRELNEKRSRRRSQRLMMRHVRNQGMDCLVTLTVGGDRLPDGYEALQMAVDWYRHSGRELFGGSPAIFVPEHGERNGRIHVHIGIKRSGAFFSYRRIITSWSRWLTAAGYVSPCGTHRVDVGRGGGHAKKLAGYLGKYLAKGLGALPLPMGAHRFRSVGCEAVVPVWVEALPSVEALLSALGMRASELHAYLRQCAETTYLVGFGFEGG